MSRKLSLAIVSLLVIGCTGNMPGVLPPAPKPGVLALAERMETKEVERSPVAEPDTVVVPDRIRDAGTMEVVELPVVEPRVKRRGGSVSNLVPRFPDAESELKNETTRAAKSSVLADTMKWVPLDEATDSMLFHKSWKALDRRMTVGTTFEVRRLVWPTPVQVIEGVDGRFTLATGWIEFRRLSPREMRCSVVDRPSKRVEEEGSAVRLVAELSRITGESGKIMVRFESRGLQGCTVSVLGMDRLASFRYDIWGVANRVSSLERSNFWLERW